MREERYDLVVAGGGTGGLVSAAIAAGLGARVALVERDRMGGDCLWTGCVPSKALLASARAAAAVRRAEGYGVAAGDPAPDFALVMERMRGIREALAVHDSPERFRGLGVDVIRAEARFTGKRTIEAAGRRLRFRRAIVATGSRPVVPPVPGLAAADPLTTDTVWDLGALPARLLVVGGGPSGCELAQAFARLGARVLLVESAPHVLPAEEPDAAEVVARALREDGVAVLAGHTIEGVEARGAASVLHLSGDGVQPLEVDRILVAAGRAPVVEALDPGAAGVRWDAEHGIAVDDSLRTTNRRVYAVGDVASSVRLTHLADAHARLAVRNALFPGRKAELGPVPRCVYTEPELARVGHTAESAARAGIRVTTFTQPFAEVDRAVLDGETGGFARLHVKAGSDEIVGATAVGAHAGEAIAEIALAMAEGLTLASLSETIHAYPTRAEAWRKIGDQAQRARLTPIATRALRAWLAVSRAFGR